MEKLKVGILFLQICIVLTILTGSYALWTQTLYIDGTIETGAISAEWIIQNCHDNEPVEENISDISATVEESTLHVMISNAYPTIVYTVEFEIYNTGSIPLLIYQFPIDTAIPGIISITNVSDQQLLPRANIEGNITIELNDSAQPQTTYYFQVIYTLYQWNEEYIPAPTHQPPVAIADVPSECYQLETITLDGSSSYDSDGTITLYEWDFDGDGIWDWSSTTTGTTTHSYDNPGVYTTILQITDSTNLKDTASQHIQVQLVDIYVDDDFDETTPGWQDTHFNSIQPAINHLNSGTIYVKNGIYQEHLIINKSITLVGEDIEHTILSGNSPINISSYQIKQYTSDYTFTFPEDTFIEPGGYLIIARDAIQEAFESYWNKTLPSNAIYINSEGGFPSINGDETYELQSNTDAAIDGPSGQPLSVGTTIQRINTSFEATLAASWSIQPLSNATPGYGANGDQTAGLIINEYADTTGTGNYIYEYVELYYDAQGTATIITITADETTISRFTITKSGTEEDDAGVKIESNSNLITNNNFYENTIGVHIKSGDHSLIYNNIFENSINAWDAGTNYWNHTIIEQTNIVGGPFIVGNYWNDYSGADADLDLIGDTPYPIPGGSNMDYYPLLMP